jgi:hypothetical protein
MDAVVAIMLWTGLAAEYGGIALLIMPGRPNSHGPLANHSVNDHGQDALPEHDRFHEVDRPHRPAREPRSFHPADTWRLWVSLALVLAGLGLLFPVALRIT